MSKKHHNNDQTLPIHVLLGVLLLMPIMLLLINNVLPHTRKTLPFLKQKTPPYVSPPPIKIEQENPYVIFLDKLDNRRQLSQTDQQVKQNLLKLAQTTPAKTIYATPLYSINYLANLDIFQAEIRTSNIDDGRREAYQWFVEQGMSHQGICDLPVHFYLSPEVKEYLQRPTIDINPLPPGCY